MVNWKEINSDYAPIAIQRQSYATSIELVEAGTDKIIYIQELCARYHGLLMEVTELRARCSELELTLKMQAK